MILMIAIILAVGIFSSSLVLRTHLRQMQRNQRSADVGHLKIDAPMAKRILDLKPDASAEQVTAAYRRLVAKLHPDQGGSAFLMEMVMHAKQVLDRKS